jgi:hypothetical protein
MGQIILSHDLSHNYVYLVEKSATFYKKKVLLLKNKNNIMLLVTMMKCD